MRTDPFLFAQHLRPLYGPNPESLMRTVTVDFSGAASGSLPFFCFVAVVVLGVGITLGHYLGYYVPPTPTPFVRDFTEKDIDVIFALMLKEERFEEMLAEYAGTEAGLRIQAKEQQAILLEWEQLPFDWDPIFIEII